MRDYPSLHLETN